MAKQIVFSLLSLKDGEIPDEGTMSDMLVKRGPTYKGTASIKEADSTVFDVLAEEYPEPDESFTTEGLITLVFSTYDYDPEMLVAYKGGSITDDDMWAKPAYPPEIERSWQTISKDGYLVEIPRGKLRSKFNYEMKQDGVALLENTVTALKPRGAGVASIFMGKYKLPMVSAGNAQNITVANANLTGTASAFRGTISSQIWTCVQKPVAAADPGITTPATLNTAITGLVTGTYKFQLAVADENGFENKATVTVTVALP
ncbi:hypothetical protein J3L18_23225 [Mucilaginibacter gossypii]|uniref:PKD domain-containing protein n=1 Tax=Mucilaginibacter gossypii TaxID=551996 RepID=UPI00101A67E0|nr:MULTISPECIES: hypothetical protein [Mucilaginibacter]QTE36027.1 hypothetical protein J3L18_23225 [Mucilaginibacter gossypii]